MTFYGANVFIFRNISDGTRNGGVAGKDWANITMTNDELVALIGVNAHG